MEVNVDGVTTDLCRLLANGERRVLGWACDEFVVPEDFNAPVPEIEDAFYR